MPKHSHEFVEEYNGFVGFGFDRPTDEASLIVYLQKFSDDSLVAVLRRRLGDEEIDHIVDMISGVLRKHLNEDEYHDLFLKEPHAH